MMNYKYTPTHEWINPHAEQAMSVGITDQAQKLLGDLVYIELPAEGRHVTAGEEIGVVESVKAASDFYAPISGTICAVNHELAHKPDLVNSSPFENGWLVKINPSRPDELDELMDFSQYEHHTGKEG